MINVSKWKNGHLASGIGLKAIEAGYKVFFTTAVSLVEALEIAELKGELKKKINSLLKFDLTTIKDFTKWGEFFFFMLGGESYRLRDKLCKDCQGPKRPRCHFRVLEKQRPKHNSDNTKRALGGSKIMAIDRCIKNQAA